MHLCRDNLFNMMKLNHYLLLFLLAASILTVASCKKEDQGEIDQQLIEDFINEHQLDADSTASGLYYVIDVPGSSEHPTIDSEVTIDYIGFMLTGDVFDSNVNVTFPLNALILGWQEGIPLFGKGGSGLLIVPSRLGYGERRVGTIPPNSVLVFEIHLNNFH